MTEKKYRDHQAISQSDIKDFIKSPMIYYHKKILGNKEKGTKELIFGSLVDNLIFDPDFKYVLVPKDLDRRTKEGKIQWEKILSEEDKGCQIVDEWDFEKANKMIEVIKSNKIANKLLFELPGENQPQIFFKYNGNDLKCKLDRLTIDHDRRLVTIVDYKTSSKLNAHDFGWSVKDFGYHIQQSFYKAAIKDKYSDLFESPFGNHYKLDFVFIVQYKEPPFHIYCVRLSEYDESIGENAWKTALEDISSRTITNQWEPESFYQNDGIADISVFKM